MGWEHVVEQLETILQAPIKREVMTAEAWLALTGKKRKEAELVRVVVKDQYVYFLLGQSGDGMADVLLVEEESISPSEQGLVQMVIEARIPSKRSTVKASPAVSEDERRALLLRDWLLSNLEKGEIRADMPEPLASRLSLYTPRIPFLLYGDYSDHRKVTYLDFKRLLESFFDAEILLVPLLDKEWLILGSESLLTASRDEDREDEEDESVEEALSSICGGLYEMLSNEWVGESHITINYPKTPAASLLTSICEMREAIRLGKMYHIGKNLHFPWNMHMEKLLYAVPDLERALFVEHVLRGIDHVLDAEMLSTLEHFFALDCNVSETAKQLYIHRNTLLYRLDKFKQETGKDVRTFSDAVLVKTALLLYKVTKRK